MRLYSTFPIRLNRLIDLCFAFTFLFEVIPRRPFYQFINIDNKIAQAASQWYVFDGLATAFDSAPSEDKVSNRKQASG